jgi:opacity protein-like surface antigen
MQSTTKHVQPMGFDVRARTRTTILGLAVAAALALPYASHAQVADQNTWFVTLDGGVNYTDNVSRSQVDEESETIGTAGLLLGITTDRPNLDADVAAHLEYLHYLDDTFDSEVVGGVNAFVAYAFIPERFLWVVEDNFSQISSDITAVDTPDNRENVNFLSTGPDFTIGLTARTSLQLSGRVSDAYYEERETDSQGLSGSVALIRQMSDASSLSLNGSTSETDYDEEVFSDFRIDSAFLRWQTVTERTTLILDGGYDRVVQDDPFNLTEDDESGGFLARLELSRAVGARSRVGVIAGTGLETPDQGLQRIQDVIGVDPGDDEDAIVGSDAYRADYAFLTFNTDWERGAFAAVIDARSETHEVETEADRDAYGALIEVSRQISRRFTANLNGRYTKNDFSETGFEFDEWSVGAGLSMQVSERLSFQARVAHIEGSSDDGTRDFDENTAYIGFSYTRGR